MSKNNNLSDISYENAVKLIDSSIITENHNILDTTVNDIEDSVLICENPEIELNPMRTNIFYIMPEFLENTNDEQLIKIKKEIEFYKKEYESLCNKMNDFVDKVNKSLKGLINPSNNLKNQIEDMILKFEENITKLSIPLYLEQEGLNNIDISTLNKIQKDEFNEYKLSIKYIINDFENKSEKLNNNYNILFTEIKKAVEIICNNIKEIPNNINELQDKIEEGMSKFEEILELFDEENEKENFLNYFGKIKESFKLIDIKKDELINKNENKINNLKNQYIKRQKSFLQLKDDTNKIIKNLEEKSNIIKNDIIKTREKYNQPKLQIEIPDMTISEIVIIVIFNEIDKEIIKAKEEVKNGFKGMPSPSKKMALDLLLIMDITGSMEQYVDQVKFNLIDIMNKIENKCNKTKIDINLGFIGYKDVEEIYNNEKECVNIEFTKDYTRVKNQIEDINVGGGDDTAEHIVWGFEKAL